MLARTKATDLRSYTSDRVFDGKRPLSAVHAAKLRARHQQPPAAKRRFVGMIVAMFGVFIAAAGRAFHG